MRFKGKSRHYINDLDLTDLIGIVTSVSEPSPLLPYQVITITFNDITCDGILASAVEVVNSLSTEG